MTTDTYLLIQLTEYDRAPRDVRLLGINPLKVTPRHVTSHGTSRIDRNCDLNPRIHNACPNVHYRLTSKFSTVESL